MKNVLIFLLSSVIILSACGPTPEEVRNYNDKIIKQQTKIKKSIDNLEIQFKSYDPEKIQPVFNIAKTVTTEGLVIIKKIGSFDKSTKFKDATIQYCEIIQKTLDEEYTEMLKIYSIPDSLYNEEVEIKWNNLRKSVDEKLSEGFSKFSAAQENFATKHNLKLIKPD